MPNTFESVAAPREMQRVLEKPPQTSTTVDSRGVLVQVWQHGELHDSTRPMSDHVFMTYNGSARRIERRGDGKVQRSVTRDDSVTLIPASEQFQWDIYGSLNATHVYLSAQRMTDLALAAGMAIVPELVACTAGTDALGAHLIRVLGRGDQVNDRLSSMWLDTAADMLYLHILREHAAGTRHQETFGRGGLAPWQLKRVTDYMVAHLCEDMLLADIAKLVDLSTYHFCRAFKVSTGLPPHRWRQRLRIESAQHQLLHSDLPVADIGFSVGYDDASLFASTFRRATGCTPSEYRRLRRRA